MRPFFPTSRLAALLLAAPLTLWANPENLLPNGDLEQWTQAPENRPPQHIATADGLIPTQSLIIVETSPAGQTTPSTASQDSLIKHNGNYAIKLENTAGEDSVALSTREIPVEPNQRYLVKAWVRGDSIESSSKESGVFLWVHQGPSEGFWDQEPSIRKPHRIPDTTGSFDWMPYEVEVETRPDDSRIRIAVQLRKSSGSLWIDDVELLPVAP